MFERFRATALPALEAEIVIEAPIERVWEAVSDLSAMSERSPETVAMFITSRPGYGSWGFNLNRRGLVWWPTIARIQRWKPPVHDGTAALAFAVSPSNAVWSYELDPVPTGTRVIERRSSVHRTNLVTRAFAGLFLGGSTAHEPDLLDGLHATLAALKAELETAPLA